MDRGGDPRRSDWAQQQFYFDPPTSNDGSFALNEAAIRYHQDLYNRRVSMNGGYGLAYMNEAMMPRVPCPCQGGYEYHQNTTFPQTPEFWTSGHHHVGHNINNNAMVYDMRTVQMMYEIVSESREARLKETITSLELRNQELEEYNWIQVREKMFLRDEVKLLKAILDESARANAVQDDQTDMPLSDEGSCLT